jgi:amidohydrolase
MDLKDKIKSLARKFSQEIIGIRRHIHKYPEISFQEFKTSEYIASKLKNYNIPFRKGFVKTGIVAKIEGNNSGKKVIALRADIDALPINEQTSLSFRSAYNGIMHACGHDVHTASLIGTGRILKELINQLEGTILLIFQPGEEVVPGGAKLMLEQGVFSDLIPDIVIGQHVLPELDTGTFGFRQGKYMASNDEIYITVKGKGGHAAIPEQTTDTVSIASKIIVTLKDFINQNNTENNPTILSFGKIQGKGATNVIPDEVKIAGTFRTFDETWRKKAHIEMKNFAESLAAESGGSCDFKVVQGYPSLFNNPKVTSAARKFTEEFIGKKNVFDINQRMTSEDFAFYSQVFPSTFYRMGVRNKQKGITSSLHTPTFNIDEDAIIHSMGNMAWLAISFLKYKI